LALLGVKLHGEDSLLGDGGRKLSAVVNPTDDGR
jgi:hypothetical protein